jgi:hypothetical protein
MVVLMAFCKAKAGSAVLLPAKVIVTCSLALIADDGVISDRQPSLFFF